MRFHNECLFCTLRQAISVASILELNEADTERVVRDTLRYLSEADYTKSTPEIMGGVWAVLLKYGQSDDPYREAKRACNEAALAMLPDVRAAVAAADDPLDAALHYAIAGNLIDFAPQHAFSMDTLQAQIGALAQKPFVLDDSSVLRERLAHAETLLYICDNCGEIVFDRVLIEQIRTSYPQLSIRCAVRGAPVINDVTREDAAFAGMDEVAEVIDSGDDSAGTVLSRVSGPFRRAFFGADVIIAKGQGNFESTAGVEKDGLFYLFTVKCAPVSDMAGVPTMSIVCMQAK